MIGTYIKAAINVNTFGEVRLSERIDIDKVIYNLVDVYASYDFSWDDDDRIRQYPVVKLGFPLRSPTKIERTENSVTIIDSTGNDRILLEIDNKKREVILKINDSINNTYKLITKLKNNKLYVYDASNIFEQLEKSKVYDFEIQSLTDIIKELFKIRSITQRTYYGVESIRMICIENFGPKCLEDLIEHRQNTVT